MKRKNGEKIEYGGVATLRETMSGKYDVANKKYSTKASPVSTF